LLYLTLVIGTILQALLSFTTKPNVIVPLVLTVSARLLTPIRNRQHRKYAPSEDCKLNFKSSAVYTAVFCLDGTL